MNSRGTTQIAPNGATSRGSNKPFAFTRQVRKPSTGGKTRVRDFGSEGIVKTRCYRLAAAADSLETRTF